MSEIKSLEGWSATVDHRLDALISFNDVRREGQHRLAESIGKNRGEVDREMRYLRTEIAGLRKLINALTLSLVMVGVSLALAGGGLALVVLS